MPMRVIWTLRLCAALSMPAWETLAADPGTQAERVSRASSLEQGYGAVVISIRSEIYLDEPLDVFFLREGGDVSTNDDVVRFERKQGLIAFGNDTLKYKVRAYQIPPGTYRLVAHGMECPKVPAEDERCLIDAPGLFGREEISRPSRGYGGLAPTFEVRAGAVTFAGDFALTSRNTIEWSELPDEELRAVQRRFSSLAQAPEPTIPEQFRLKYGLFPRSYEDDLNRRY
ncbi:hypothetical protein CD351_09555 [Erythrobacter sp. KY5]|nr:hypothetical protein CD351_09555 [Erythrobacter sp. KY5]